MELRVSCRSLRDLDTFSKSDPFVTLHLKDNITGSWNKVGETEVLKNNLNPNFKYLFSLNYMFEEKQECRIEV